MTSHKGFINRTILKGTLTTQSPLHIGSGAKIVHEKIKNDGKDVLISGIMTDCNNRAHLPGSGSKGCLRGWLASRVVPETLKKLFGIGPEEGKKNQEGWGGQVVFFDSFCVKPICNNHQIKNDPTWKEQRQTHVIASTTIDRITRSSKENKLYYFEVVPPGVVFQVTLYGRNLGVKDMQILRAGLEGFMDEYEPVVLGGMASSGFGRMIWEEQEIFEIKKSDLESWIKDAKEEKGGIGYQVATKNHISPIPSKTLKESKESLNYLLLELEIQFETNFLVNDPFRAAKTRGQDQKEPDQTYRIDNNGKILLTEKSLKGAIRAQVERIIRTIEPEGSNLACYIDSTSEACKPIAHKNKIQDLCLVCQLFGGNGLGSPIHFTDFQCVEEGEEVLQEFVAIDRFTGGSKLTAKFNSRSRYKPKFIGKIRLNLNRIKNWGFGILVLALRDFIEGDVRLGFGATKGYGECRLNKLSYSFPPGKNISSGTISFEKEAPVFENDLKSKLEVWIKVARSEIKERSNHGKG